jgi:hypothetical protein
VLVTRARPVFFCVTDFGKRCNEKETKNEETNFVKWVVKIVRRSLMLRTLVVDTGFPDSYL